MQRPSMTPKKRLLPGDSKIRVCTQAHKKPTPKKKRKLSEFVSAEQYKDEWKGQPKGKKARFCNMETLVFHQASSKDSKTSQANCVVCNKGCYTTCEICGVRLHFPNGRSKKSDGSCFVWYHYNKYFGLCACDLPLRGNNKKDWKKPSQTSITANKKVIEAYELGANSGS